MPCRLALVFCLAIAPVLTPGADGGIFRSSDVFTALPGLNQTGAPHFEGRLGRGLTTHFAYSIATDLHDSTNAIMTGGLQDNGTRLRVVASGVPSPIEAMVLGDDASSPDYDPVGNLTGATNAIDGADFTALVQKMGGRP